MVTSSIVNIFRVTELRRRIFFTLGMLAIYRLGVFITTPGVDRNIVREAAKSAGGFFQLFKLFSGGALEQASIFALGIMPYISASIIMQLLTVVIPALEKMQKEGDVGRRKIQQYSRYLTILIAIGQSWPIINYVENLRSQTSGMAAVMNPGWGFRLLTMLSLASGTAFIMWLGEQVTERGIGNGTSLVIFSGIVSGIPDALFMSYSFYRAGKLDEFKIGMLGLLMVTVVGVVIFFERGQRRIPIQYAKRVVGRKLYGGQSTHLPLKVNTSGVIPPIFAGAILTFPSMLAGLFPWLQRFSEAIGGGGWLYNSIYVLLIIFFAYFYTAVTFQPVDVADNLKKFGGYIPGIRPGKKTAEYIDFVLSRITFGGALYLAAVCVLPSMLINEFGVPFYFGGTALLIVVGVALDTVQQIEGHLITRHYEGFTGPRGPRIRGRREVGGQVATA